MGSIATDQPDFDVIILGSGLSGICSLYHIRKQFPTWRIKVIEAAESVGGTWYWNRYPGARVDTEALSYCFSFDKDILKEWYWKDTFATQPDVLEYINFVCSRLDLVKHVQFNTKIQSATWDDVGRSWLLVDQNQHQYATRFLVSCIGFLSAPTLPAIPGIDKFKGEAFHTSRWPRDLRLNEDFAEKRIGIIGTGATGIQVITAISAQPNIKSLHVFQRRANWSAPLRNAEISAEDMVKHHAGYGEIFRQCASTPSGFLHAADPRKSSEVTHDERVRLWDKLYEQPGFSKWLGPFSDTYTDSTANKMYSDWMASKIRERVDNPAIAESLIPKDHGFGTRRIPLESGYFEAYNKPHIHLVDLKKSPIQQVTDTGIKTEDGSAYDLDILIFATGFDAITGAFNAIEWHAKHDKPLIGTSNDASGKGRRAIWLDHKPSTFLGTFIPDMPNLLMVLGPHQPFGNAPRSIEHSAQLVTDLLSHCEANNYSYVEVTPEAAQRWNDHVVECSKGALSNEVDSWMTGINSNVPGKTVRSIARYAGSAIEYRRRCKECKDAGWRELMFA